MTTTEKSISSIRLNGESYSINDAVAREQIAALGIDPHPIGSIYETKLSSDNPAQNFGGTWELEEEHQFRGVYSYTRLA